MVLGPITLAGEEPKALVPEWKPSSSLEQLDTMHKVIPAGLPLGVGGRGG